MSQVRIAQGLNAPFKLEMERKYANKIGRLPCLRSSNLMLDVLKGTDETLEIEDVLNSNLIYSPFIPYFLFFNFNFYFLRSKRIR
jgi:hypothetical protein